MNINMNNNRNDRHRKERMEDERNYGGRNFRKGCTTERFDIEQ